MVISFPTALQSSAQTESGSELPSRSPCFHRCLFLLLSKKKSFSDGWSCRKSILVPRIGSQNWTLLLANITPLGLRHRHPGQALTIPGWRTSGNLYLFPYPTIKKGLSFPSLFLISEKGFDQCHIHSQGLFRLLFECLSGYCTLVRSVWFNFTGPWLNLLISVNMLLTSIISLHIKKLNIISIFKPWTKLQVWGIKSTVNTVDCFIEISPSNAGVTI